MPTKKGNRARGSLRGKGDYTAATQAIKNPLARVESKIDHLEQKLVKDLMSKSSAAATIGRTLGNFAGQGDLGALAGSTLAKYFGHGDYKVHSNSLMKGTPATGASFSRDGKRGTRIVEREFIGDIVSGPLSGASTAFTVQNFVLNPTDHTTFPWLSKMSNLFDQWEPNGIVFEFISTSSEFNGTSQALGAVIISTDYDGYDPIFTSKQEMENADYACSSKPADNLLHGVECDPRERPTPVLYTSTLNGAPITATTLGTTQVATQGCSVANVTLGELWVSYDITFYKKQMHASPYSAPVLSSTGTVVINGPYIISPDFARTITMEQLIGVGTRFHLNNGVPGQNFLMTYYIYSGAGTNDEANFWGTPILTGCTRTGYRIARSSGGEMIAMVKYTTIAPKATIEIAENTDGVTSSPYSFNLVQVPAEFIP